MTTVTSMFLSIRKFFGYLVPGFSTLVILYYLWPKSAPSILTTLAALPLGSLLLGNVLLVTSYLLGGMLTGLSFDLLRLVGDGVDKWISWFVRRSPLACRAVTFLSRRFRVLNVRTLQETTARGFAAIDAEGAALNNYAEAGMRDWGLYKMYVQEHAPALAKEAMEEEGVINFYCGMYPVLLAVGVLGVVHRSLPVSLLGFLIASYLSLRFQYLRHSERILVFQAYGVARQAKPQRPGSPNAEQAAPSEE